MTWYDKIIAAHAAVTDDVGHGQHMQSDRYFVWQEDGSDDCMLDGRHAERAVTGTTDLYTKTEFDPWRDEFEKALDADLSISWYLNSVQFEERTGFWHYEWVWMVIG